MSQIMCYVLKYKDDTTGLDLVQLVWWVKIHDRRFQLSRVKTHVAAATDGPGAQLVTGFKYSIY